jgi:predicted alpha/beta hydrolase
MRKALIEAEVQNILKLECLAVVNNLAFQIFCSVPAGSAAAHWGTVSAMTQEHLLRLVQGVQQAGQLHLILMTFLAWAVVWAVALIAVGHRRTTLVMDWRRHCDSSSSYWRTNKCCKELQNNKTISTGWQCRVVEVVVRTEEQTSTWRRKISLRCQEHLQLVPGVADLVDRRPRRPLLC